MKKRNSGLWMMALICIVLLGSGCGNNGNNGNEDAGHTNGVKSQSYDDDGYLGITNSYPRMPGPNMANTYAADGDLMREAIRNVPGVGNANVTFNGAEAYVTIKLVPGLEAREIPTVERQAASVLRFNFPRYAVHVSSVMK